MPATPVNADHGQLPGGSLDPDSRLPLHHQLRDALAARVIGGEWRPGDALPSEQGLAEHYGVAPGTMRRAIETLVHEGWLERRQGRGTFVRRPDFTASLFRFFRFQSDGAERRVPESRILARDVAAAPPVAAAPLGLTAGEQAITLLRLRLVRGQPLLIESIWLPFAPFEALATLPLSEFGDLLYPLYESLCGQVVARAEEELTAEPAEARYARPLRIDAGAPVIVVERLAFDYRDRPLEWRRSRGPATLFRYRVDIR